MNNSRINTIKEENIIDLSHLNLIDAIKKVVYFSTSNFLEYDNRRIKIILKDEVTKNLASSYKLKNTTLETGQKLRKVIGIE